MITRFLSIIALSLHVLSAVATAGEIHDASRDGDIQKVKSLVTSDTNLVRSTDDRGRTPLHLAASGGHTETARYLLEHGAVLEQKDGRGNTPLLSAVWGNHLDVVRLLTDQGANLQAEHPSYGPAIDIAYWQECIKGHSGITQFMMSRGVPFDPNSEFMTTRLNLATTFGNYDMASFVVALGADVNKISTGDGMSELHFAVACGHADIVRLLIEHEASVMVTDNNGTPPIWHAVAGGHAEIVQLLLDQGSAVDYVDTQSGRSLLHAAALGGYAEVVQLLLSRGLDANAVDGKGRTPLYYAGRYGHARVAELLTANGAVVPGDFQEKCGVSPLLAHAVPAGSATCWALHGRGWAVKTAHHLLILDCLQSNITRPTEPSLANGFIRASEIADQDVYVLYTTFHWPDLVEYVHTIEDSLPQIMYVHNKNEPWRGCRNTVYIEPYETQTIGDLRLRAIQITHANPGLAFLLEIDGLKFFWATFEPDDEASYLRDLDSLHAAFGSVDMALVPLPARASVESSFLKPLVETLKPTMICLSDSKGRLDLQANVREAIAQWDRAVVVSGPENPGDHFVLPKTE